MEMQIPTSKEIEKVKEKKPRKKTLPVKYNQMLVFGYWMLGNMKSEESISNDVFESMMRKLHIFDGTDLQIEFLDNFMHQFPEINKQWKKDVLPKEKKEKKQASKETKETSPLFVPFLDFQACNNNVATFFLSFGSKRVNPQM